ncbi:hypothetical protein [Sporosarcina luteola]|uniref:hypothetical protein n=1 Tax=Sporosarcina luteola TaxID=582850 RepID=UPI00203BB9A9|nr:hypothetical protein [Sporosarcina luteola]MCM3710973.1 hypothetical protein [Sporosarcina luteola]
MKFMLRIIIMALFAGSITSISAISFFKGFDLEGALVGLSSLVFLFGITSFFYSEYKKQLIRS